MRLERRYDQATIGIFISYSADSILEDTKFPQNFLGSVRKSYPNTSFSLAFLMHFSCIAFYDMTLYLSKVVNQFIQFIGIEAFSNKLRGCACSRSRITNQFSGS